MAKRGCGRRKGGVAKIILLNVMNMRVHDSNEVTSFLLEPLFAPSVHLSFDGCY